MSDTMDMIIRNLALRAAGLEARLTAELARAERLEGLLGRAVKYAHEDGMRTPGVTRLARVLAEAAEALADSEVKPDDPDSPRIHPTSGRLLNEKAVKP